MTATEDLFTPIHKGLRSMLYHLSSRLQTNDFADATATASLATDLEHDFAVARSAGCVLCVMGKHASDEETQIFSAPSLASERLVAELIEEHHALTRRELALEKGVHEISGMPSPEERVAAGRRLNAAANELLVAYLAHMNREETELTPFMQQHLTDAEMLGMQGKIIASLPPDRLFAILGWMLPSLNVTELSRLLASVRPNAPPPFFRAVTDLCAARVDPSRWQNVKLRVGL